MINPVRNVPLAVPKLQQYVCITHDSVGTIYCYGLFHSRKECADWGKEHLAPQGYAVAYLNVLASTQKEMLHLKH